MQSKPLALAFSAVLLAPMGLAQNLLANPSFENGLAGWSSFGPNVYAELANPPAVTPRTGNVLCKMYGQFIGGTNVTGIFQSFPASPGQTYTLDCWSRHYAFDPLAGSGGPNDNSAVMKMVFYDVANIEVGSAERRILDGGFPTNTWINNAPVAGTAPAGTVRVEALILFIQPAVGTGAAQFDDVEFSLPPVGGATYPGTGEDLVLSTGVAGAVPSAGPGNDVKSATGGNIFEVNVSSPGGTFDLVGYYVVGDLFATGSPPVPAPALPELWFSFQTFFVLVNGAPGPILSPPLIGPNGGTSTFFQVPPGLAGSSVMVQALVINPMVANTVYASSDAHEIRFQ